MRPLVLCLMGPTASGKTALAVEIVKRFPCEIISVDSAMVYRGLDIGTAKPDAATLQQAPHRLLDICDPADVYSAGDFKKDALREIENIIQQHKIPLLVGGTMMYFHILEHGLDDIPSRDNAVRTQIQQQAEQEGWPALHEKLKNIDPKAALRIHPHDSQRIQRALEVYTLSGKPITQHQQLSPPHPAYTFHHLVLCPADRSHLHARIEKRFLTMLDLGFMEEVKKLHQRPDLSLEKPALRAVGYRQAWEYLSGKLTWDEMKEKTIIATRQLAKRQLTWLRRWKEAVWFDSEREDLVNVVTKYLENILR